MGTIARIAEETHRKGFAIISQYMPHWQCEDLQRNIPNISKLSLRPVQGSKGYCRAHVKQAVSAVHRGERVTLGIIFHEALS